MGASVATVAMLMQGRAHDVTRQKATLRNLEDDDKHGRTRKLAFEWSHVCYFPALLWRSALESAGYLQPQQEEEGSGETGTKQQKKKKKD